jgi:hypothetical protein
MLIMDSAELIDKIVGGDASSLEVSDYIKGLLYTKSGEKVDALKPEVSAGLFGDKPEAPAPEPEAEAEVETEVEAEVETEPEVEPESQEEE